MLLNAMRNLIGELKQNADDGSKGAGSRFSRLDWKPDTVRTMIHLTFKGYTAGYKTSNVSGPATDCIMTGIQALYQNHKILRQLPKAGYKLFPSRLLTLFRRHGGR